METTYDLDIESTSCIKALNYNSFSCFKREMRSINDIHELEHAIAEFRGMNGYNFLYRGLSDSSYELLPTIVRNDVKNYSQEVSILEKAKLVCRKYGYDKFSIHLRLVYVVIQVLCRVREHLPVPSGIHSPRALRGTPTERLLRSSASAAQPPPTPRTCLCNDKVCG